METAGGREGTHVDRTSRGTDEHDISNDDDVLRSPTALIELFSDNMGADLTDKLAEYQSLKSVEEYVVMDSRKRWLRRYYRNADGHLVFDHDSIGGHVRLPSIGFTRTIDALTIDALTIDALMWKPVSGRRVMKVQLILSPDQRSRYVSTTPRRQYSRRGACARIPGLPTAVFYRSDGNFVIAARVVD